MSLSIELEIVRKTVSSYIKVSLVEDTEMGSCELSSATIDIAELRDIILENR